MTSIFETPAEHCTRRTIWIMHAYSSTICQRTRLHYHAFSQNPYWISSKPVAVGLDRDGSSHSHTMAGQTFTSLSHRRLQAGHSQTGLARRWRPPIRPRDRLLCRPDCIPRSHISNLRGMFSRQMAVCGMSSAFNAYNFCRDFSPFVEKANNRIDLRTNPDDGRPLTKRSLPD
ncbi:hypothetical protein L228DRAFT_51404 [Xylona heveae TC161]|uniref:Uncharacterized protein n=1 Tax=Xylona heveae (strain CBS 132557 / TC161) TaxID=1328760 RepID=A0A164ZD78_XYLHT|nr:hypothetical protein L228DRAFT_51404 [Xylona heveae TC161]KZF18955.1 hypothetical protein L228DRAFT_51404 [Xylona heveae TC161]